MRKLLQPFIDKVQTKYRNFKYKEDVYFKIVGFDDVGILKIELLKGKYKGILYSLGSIKIEEDLVYLGSKATFDVVILNTDLSEEEKQKIMDRAEFSKITGDIFLVIIGKAIQVQMEKYYRENLEDEEVGTDYIEEPIPRRTVRQKNSAVSEERVPPGKKRKNPVRRNSKVRSKVQSSPKS